MKAFKQPIHFQKTNLNSFSVRLYIYFAFFTFTLSVKFNRSFILLSKIIFVDANFEKSIFFLSLAQKYRNFLRFNTMSTENKKPNRSLNPMDYTFNDVEQLSRFVTETGKILPRKITGLSAKHQRRITNTIKRARNMITMK